jgi:condensin complex subunit 3
MDDANKQPGEEKKTIAPLLAKLHISPASTESLIRELYDEVSTAIEEKLIADATGRNALFKIHVSLGKIVNSLTEKEKASGGRKSSVAPSVLGEEDKTVMTIEADAEEEAEGEKTELVKVEEEEDEGTVIADVDAKATRDSLVESLLEDSDVEMTG